VAAILSVALMASSVHACLNDRETTNKETEFQVQYRRSISDEPPVASIHESLTIIDYALIGAGGLLGTTGLGIGMGVGIMLARKS
jgi:hypothetical protein